MTRMRTRLLLFVGFMLSLWACEKAEQSSQQEAKSKTALPKDEPTSAEAPDSSGVFSDIAVVFVPIPDFSKLSLLQKTNLYLLNTAAAVQDDIRTARAPDEISRIHAVLRGILKAKPRVPPSVFTKVETYSERFFLHGGPNDAWTGARLRPPFIPGELAAAAEAAVASGIDIGMDSYTEADLGANRLDQLLGFLTSLRPVLFGGDTPVAPSESTAASASRDAPPNEQMKASAKQAADALRSLRALVQADEKAPLESLAAFFENGDPSQYADYLGRWQQAARPVELVAFFEEGENLNTDEAPPGRFQLIAAFIDADQTPLVQKVAAKAAYFERILPGNAMFKRSRKDIVKPASAAYFVSAAPPWSSAVDTGAFSYPLPIAQPSAQGTKTLLFLHAALAREKAFGEQIAKAFSADEETLFLRLKWREAALSAYLVLKNVIGYQAGVRKARPDGETRIRSGLSPVQGILEEIHSDLIALHFAFDPESQAVGLIPEPECARALLLTYISQILEQAFDSADPNTLRGRQVIARRAVVRGLLKSGAASVDRINGHFFVAIKDVEAARKSIELQLAEAQRMIFLNAAEDAQSLIDTDGGPLPGIWQKDAEKRLRQIGVHPKTAYLFSMLTAKKDASGKIEDVSATMPESLSDWISRQ